MLGRREILPDHKGKDYTIIMPVIQQGLRMVFSRGFSESEEKIMYEINRWLHMNSYFGNMVCEIDVDCALGFFVNRFRLKELLLKYDVLSEINPYIYHFVRLDECDLFRVEPKELLEKWKACNPGAVIIKAQSTTNMRGGSLSVLVGGLGAVNRAQVFIFFKTPRNPAFSHGSKHNGQPGVSLPPQQPKRSCPSCGRRTMPGNAFCGKCGTRII